MIKEVLETQNIAKYRGGMYNPVVKCTIYEFSCLDFNSDPYAHYLCDQGKALTVQLPQ